LNSYDCDVVFSQSKFRRFDVRWDRLAPIYAYDKYQQEFQIYL